MKQRIDFLMAVPLAGAMLAAALVNEGSTAPALNWHLAVSTGSGEGGKLPAARANDNRIPAGKFVNGALSIGLEVGEAMWHPDADDAPGMLIHAFAEAGKRPQIPAPLIRTRAGTTVRVTVRNTLAGSTLRLHGLHDRTAERSGSDTLTVPAGETREVAFRLDAPGTYFYWGTTSNTPFNRRTKLDGQLSGAIVVDPPSGRVPRDRIMLIGEWADSLEPGGAPLHEMLFIPVINGKTWPHTERIHQTVGDTVVWRIVNPSHAAHPMHLHGFYYRIDSRGDGVRDTVYADSLRPMVVTERVPSGATMTLTWVPERPGNWIFHCHIPNHVRPHLPLDRSKHGEHHSPAHMTNHTMEGMGGLIMGIEVSGREKNRRSAHRNRRQLRLTATTDTGGTVEEPAYGFTLSENGRAFPRNGLLLPNPTIVLRRGEPVDITVLNQLPEITAIHWHGIELDSYFDGVAGFGGTKGRITPAIAPGTSFVASFTPPRAGTFIYHTHIDEPRQQPAGLSGLLIVMEPGARFDTRKDHPILISTPRRLADRPRVYLNGSHAPDGFEWRTGEKHLLRIVNMTVGPPVGVTVSLLRDSATLAAWRPVAKDGATLPSALSRARNATTRIAVGETHDIEVLLTEPGDYRLEVRQPAAQRLLLGKLAIRVR